MKAEGQGSSFTRPDNGQHKNLSTNMKRGDEDPGPMLDPFQAMCDQTSFLLCSFVLLLFISLFESCLHA